MREKLIFTSMKYTNKAQYEKKTTFTMASPEHCKLGIIRLYNQQIMIILHIFFIYYL